MCRHRAAQALKPEDKARWLKISEDWHKLAEEVDAANADRQGADKTQTENRGLRKPQAPMMMTISQPIGPATTSASMPSPVPRIVDGAKATCAPNTDRSTWTLSTLSNEPQPHVSKPGRGTAAGCVRATGAGRRPSGTVALFASLAARYSRALSPTWLGDFNICRQHEQRASLLKGLTSSGGFSKEQSFRL